MIYNYQSSTAPSTTITWKFGIFFSLKAYLHGKSRELQPYKLKQQNLKGMVWKNTVELRK